MLVLFEELIVMSFEEVIFLYLALSTYSSLHILDMNAISEIHLTKILLLLFSSSELIFIVIQPFSLFYDL